MHIGSRKAGSSFENPLTILLACHDKVRHFARLSRKLGAYVTEHGVDAEAGQAAESILRYFDLAAPLHHADEEQDLFPALRVLNRPGLDLAMEKLESEHEILEKLWHSIRPWLEAIAARESVALPPPSLMEFAQRYVQHTDHEEADVYGAVGGLSADVLAEVGRKMCARRGVK